MASRPGSVGVIAFAVVVVLLVVAVFYALGFVLGKALV